MMTTNKDSERKEALMRDREALSEEEGRARRYQQYLRMSRTENFTDLTALGAFFRAGERERGREREREGGRERERERRRHREREDHIYFLFPHQDMIIKVVKLYAMSVDSFQHQNLI